MIRLDEAQKITVEKVHTKAEKNHATQRTMAVEHPGVGELGRANSYHVHNAANEIPEGAKITFALVGNQNCNHAAHGTWHSDGAGIEYDG